MKLRMSKERLGAFMDAVIAIIMTILVLELKEPVTLDWNGFILLLPHFFAYTLSFFWLGAMWVNNHMYYERVKFVNQNTVWSAMLMLFFASLFPYITKLMASNFENGFIQSLYGGLVLVITAVTVLFYSKLNEVNREELKGQNVRDTKWMFWDVLIKIMGLIFSLTIFPPAASLSIFITLCLLVIPNQFKE